MKEKEPESFVEKDRTFRDRSKKRRLTQDEQSAVEHKPRMEPYKREHKNWMQLPYYPEDDGEL